MDNGEAAVVGDKEKEGTGDILPADSLGILAGPLLPFGEGRIIPDSVCTDDTLARLRKVYRILDVIRLSLPHRGYDVYSPPPGCLLIHVAAFECGVRLPLHPSISRLLIALDWPRYSFRPDFGRT